MAELEGGGAVTFEGSLPARCKGFLPFEGIRGGGEEQMVQGPFACCGEAPSRTDC